MEEAVLHSKVRRPFHNFEEGSDIGVTGEMELNEDKLQPPPIPLMREALTGKKTAGYSLEPSVAYKPEQVAPAAHVETPHLPTFPGNQPVPTIDSQTLRELQGEPPIGIGRYEKRPAVFKERETERKVPGSVTEPITTTGAVTRSLHNAIDTIRDKWRVLREDITRKQQESKDRVKPSFEKQLGIPERKEEVKEVNTVDRMAEKLGEAAGKIGTHPHTYTGAKEEKAVTDTLPADTRRVVIREVWIEPGKEPIEAKIDRTAEKIAAALHMDDKHGHTATEKRLDAKKDRVWLDADE